MNSPVFECTDTGLALLKEWQLKGSRSHVGACGSHPIRTNTSGIKSGERRETFVLTRCQQEGGCPKSEGISSNGAHQVALGLPRATRLFRTRKGIPEVASRAVHHSSHHSSRQVIIQVPLTGLGTVLTCAHELNRPQSECHLGSSLSARRWGSFSCSSCSASVSHLSRFS